jgi:outer membrane protein W
MKSSAGGIMFVLLFAAAECGHAQALQSTMRNLEFTSPPSDSSQKIRADSGNEQQTLRNAWGVDILISNGGFGLGVFYRREFSDEWFGFASLSVSESKDEREVEQFDYYGQSYVPGKLNRFLVLPLTFGVQHRLFKDEITENFRPYVNAGVGPTMIYVTPFTEITNNGETQTQVEFFQSLGRGQPHYTLGGFIGFGANFGTEKSNLFGVNFRYYFTYLLGEGLPSLYNVRTGDVSATKKDFGGFFITLNVGMAY